MIASERWLAALALIVLALLCIAVIVTSESLAIAEAAPLFDMGSELPVALSACQGESVSTLSTLRQT